MSRSRFLFLLLAALLVVGGILLLRYGAQRAVPELVQEVHIPEVPEGEELSLKPGDASPYFELKDLDGAVHKRTDFEGRPLVIVFWTTWNAHALDQIRVIDGYLAHTANPSFFVLAINSQEDKGRVASFFTRGGYHIPLALDEKGEVSEAYHLRVVPTIYFIDAKGIIREIAVGTLREQDLVDKASALLAGT